MHGVIRKFDKISYFRIYYIHIKFKCILYLNSKLYMYVISSVICIWYITELQNAKLTKFHTCIQKRRDLSDLDNERAFLTCAIRKVYGTSKRLVKL